MVLRSLEAGLVGGLIAGVIAALIARTGMRLLAIAEGTSAFFPSMVFTLDGTWAVLAFVALPAVWLGLLFVALRRFMPRRDVVAGLVFGLALLATLGALFLAQDVEFAHGGVNAGPGRLVFGALIPLFGLLLGPVVGMGSRSRLPVGVLGGCAFGTFFAVTAVVALLTDFSPLQRDPPVGWQSALRAVAPAGLAALSFSGAVAVRSGRASRTWTAVALAPAGLAALAGVGAGVQQLADLLGRLA